MTATSRPTTTTLLGDRGKGAMSDPLRTTLALAGLVPATIAVVTAPVPALLVVTVVGVLVGLVATAGTAVVHGSAAHAAPIGMAAAGLATESGLAVAGVLITLGPASVAVLPTLFVFIMIVWWIDSPDRVKAMLGLDVTAERPGAEHDRSAPGCRHNR